LLSGQALLAGNIVNHPATTQQETKVLDAKAVWGSPSDGLVLAGVRFFPEQQTGTATGISATKIFFAFPAKKPTRPQLP